MAGRILMGRLTSLINVANGPPGKAPQGPSASPNVSSFSRPIWPLYVIFAPPPQVKTGKFFWGLFGLAQGP